MIQKYYKLGLCYKKGVLKMTRNNDKANKLVSRLCCAGEKVIESEYFEGVNYLIKDNHIVILAGKNGELAANMDTIFSLTNEINEICKLWANI